METDWFGRKSPFAEQIDQFENLSVPEVLAEQKNLSHLQLDQVEQNNPVKMSGHFENQNLSEVQEQHEVENPSVNYVEQLEVELSLVQVGWLGLDTQ
nr:hypothetical protein Iba_scaffold88601CG0010 [Ipomoea batatas]GME13394.1 hypothetical protein Iba_scaffold14412CG0010 [Ipomoea batatas]